MALTESIMAAIERLVTCESPSNDRQSLVQCADLLGQIATDRQLPATVLQDQGGGPVLLIGAVQPTVLLLGHMDTVHPLGSLTKAPFRIESDYAYGPGVLDMKTGLIQAVYACSLASCDDVAMLVTSDEEVGSIASRDLIEQFARNCAACLVLESSRDGALKTERKGVSTYRLSLYGRATHAGLDPHRGANATVALARAILAISDLKGTDACTTITPTLASAGSSANTVPDVATLTIDVRATSTAEQERVDRELWSLTDFPPAVSVRLDGGPNRPPLTPDASAGLFALAQTAAAEAGLPALRSAAVGAGSDGNLTAALGVPTLDGLGAVGQGEHTLTECVQIAEIPPRVALLTTLLRDPRTRRVPRAEGAT